MANSLKGEVGFTVEDRDYVMVLDVNALCMLEDEFDLPASQIMTKLGQDMRVATARAFFWAGLQQHQPGTTLKDAGLLLGGVGMPKAHEIIIQAIAAAWPRTETEESPGSRPQKGRASKTATG